MPLIINDWPPHKKIETAAIVGHGPTTAGGGLGHNIDSADFVVRMINCGWQSEAVEDYGARHDASIYCPTQPDLLKDQPIPSEYYMLYRPLYRFGDKRLDWNHAELNGKPQYSGDRFLDLMRIRCTDTGAPHFSRGTAAFLLLTHWYSPKTVLMIGFSKINPAFRKITDAHHPDALKKAHPLNSRADTHDWQREFEVIRSIEDRFCMEVVWL